MKGPDKALFDKVIFHETLSKNFLRDFHSNFPPFFQFVFRYEQQEIALNCGAMLRECIRYEALTKILLNAEEFYDFFKYVEVSTFDIASDAFATFKVSISNRIHVIWFIRVISKYPVLGTLNYFDEIQYWKPLKNPSQN